jgi:hypothetical protein
VDRRERRGEHLFGLEQVWTELFAAADLFRSRWADVVAHDPQLNRHLARSTTSYRLPFHGR